MTKQFLLLSAARNSWGRAAMASTIARDLSSSGGKVTVVTHRMLEPLLQHTGATIVTFGSAMGALLGPYVDGIVDRTRPDALVLCDFFSNANAFARVGLNLNTLLGSVACSFAIDTFDYDRTGYRIDAFGTEEHFLGSGDEKEWSEQLSSVSHTLKPVPINAPNGNGSRFSSLPAGAVGRDSRSYLRALGLGDGDRAVLFCSAEWQHSRYACEAGRRLAESLPRLVAGYLATLDSCVHLIHVGPLALDLDSELGERYHWLSYVCSDVFDNIIAGVDLLLSANISATTIAKALVSGVPVLTLQNSITASTMEEACSQMKAHPSPFLLEWLGASLPLYRFLMWPLGYHAFLSPLLERNPYTDAFDVMEMLDEDQIYDKLHALLFTASAREEQLHRHATYLDRVRALPTGAQRVQQLLGA